VKIKQEPLRWLVVRPQVPAEEAEAAACMRQAGLGFRPRLRAGIGEGTE